MEEKEDKTKPTDWDSSGFYILLPCEEDCSPETMTRAFTKNTMARAECSPPHQQLASLCNGPFKVHKNNTVYERVICLVTSGTQHRAQIEWMPDTAILMNYQPAHNTTWCPTTTSWTQATKQSKVCCNL